LQELIAPHDVRFYSQDWHVLGDKHELCGLLSDITRIEIEVLEGLYDLEGVSVAKKMSWAASRQTTRSEDVAYCLLGIFDVNMPLLYGEGKKSFKRLQEEILKTHNDHSLFAWGLSGVAPPLIEEVKKSLLGGAKAIETMERETREEPLLLGLLANSPSDFANSGNIDHYVTWSGSNLATPVVGGGQISLELPLVSDGVPRAFQDHYGDSFHFSEKDSTIFVTIGCGFEDDYQNFLGLALRKWDPIHFGRLREPVFLRRTRWDNYGRQERKFLTIKPECVRSLLQDNNILLGRILGDGIGYKLSKVYCTPLGRYHERRRIIATGGSSCGPQGALIFRCNPKPDFAIILGRTPSQHNSSEPWVRGVILKQTSYQSANGNVCDDGGVVEEQVVACDDPHTD